MPPRRASRGSDWPDILAIAAFGLLFVGVALYPGFINGDSKWQLYQAREGVYNDMHPPSMAFLWRYLDLIVPGTGGLFLFQAALFWLGLGIFLVEIFPKRSHRAFAAAAAAAYIPLLATFGVLVKDGGFVYALTLCAASLLRAERKRSLPWVAAAMASLLYAMALRHNGVLAALPLTFWAGAIVASRWTAEFPLARRRVMAAMIGGMLFLYAGLGVYLINRALTGTQAHPSQLLLTWDLTGISVRTGRNYLPPNFNWDGRPLTIRQLKRVYDPESDWKIFWGPSQLPRPGFVQGDEDFEELLGAWVAAVIEQPAAYLAHRRAAFVRLMGFYSSDWPYWLPESREIAGDAPNAPLRKGLIRLTEAYGGAFVFKAWFYLVLAAACLAVGARLKVRRTVFWALGASALMYEGSHFFISPAADFRYSWWLMCASLLLLALLLAPRPRVS